MSTKLMYLQSTAPMIRDPAITMYAAHPTQQPFGSVFIQQLLSDIGTLSP